MTPGSLAQSRKQTFLTSNFVKYFRNPTNYSHLQILPTTDNPQITNIIVSNGEVLKLLQGIDPSIATGPDQIPGKLLKICASKLTYVFAILFQASLNQGIAPD